jgi:DNA-binding response OmpR family regulator
MMDKKILAVDDEESIRNLLDQALSKAGYGVLLAKNGEEAMNILKKESIMVMFLDLNLPGISGIEWCKKLKKDNPVGIIYALTGHSDFYGLLECRKAGFDDFFTKPFELSLIQKAAKDAFEKIERWNVSSYELT